MTQGERVKEIRKTLGLTLEKFGEPLGVKKNSISQIETGKNSLTDQLARAICREYNVNYDYLIYGDGEMFSNLPDTIVDELAAQFSLSDFDRSIIELYISLPEDCRKLIREKAEEMLRDKGWSKSDTY